MTKLLTWLLATEAMWFLWQMAVDPAERWRNGMLALVALAVVSLLPEEE